MPFTAQHIKAARLHLQKSDPVMKRLIKQVGPFTAKARRNRFATLVRSILAQQISTSAAQSIWKRFYDAITQRAEFIDASSESVVTPDHVKLFEIDELRELGISRQKAAYLLDLADKVESGEVSLSTIGRLGDEEVIETLTQVKGIGRWTAQMFLMFSLARLDILPVDDLGIKNAIQKQYQLEELPSPAQIKQIAQPWHPYSTIASWYLWQSMDGD